jgi:hypothetical protein
MGFLDAALRGLASGEFNAQSPDGCARTVIEFLWASAETMVAAIAPAEGGTDVAWEVAQETWAFLERSRFDLALALDTAGVPVPLPSGDAETLVQAILEQEIWQRYRRTGRPAPAPGNACRFDPIFAEAKRQTRRPRVVDVVRLTSSCTCGCGRIGVSPYEAGLCLDYNDRLPGELERAVRLARRAGLPLVFNAARAHWRKLSDGVFRRELVRYLVTLTRES